MKISHHAKTSSAAYTSSSRHDVPSWIILFAGVVALVVAMAEGFTTRESQDGTIIEIPTGIVVEGAPDTVHFLRVTLVPPEDVGRRCTVAVKVINNKSVHPNSDLLVRSDTGEVVFADIERAPHRGDQHTHPRPRDRGRRPHVRTEATNTLILGPEIAVAVRLGPDGVFSGGLVVELSGCVPPPMEIPAEKIAFAGHGKFFDKYMNEIELNTALISEIQDSMIDDILNAEDITVDSTIEEAQELVASEMLTIDETILIKGAMIDKLLQENPRPLLTTKYIWRNTALLSYHLNLHLELIDQLREALLDLLKRLGFFNPGVAPVTNYIADCRAHRVPIPPDWAESGTPWVFQGRLTQNLLKNQPLLNPPPSTQVEFAGVWTYSDPNVRGACIALPRGTGDPGSPAGIICQSAETGHACIWDNVLRDDDTPKVEEAIGWRGRRLVISQLKDLSNLQGGTGICTQCHRGNNVFLISPDDPTWAKLLRGPLSGPRTGTFTTRVEASTDNQGGHPRYIPITTLPERPGWENLFSPGGCAGACHELPSVTMPIPMPPNCARPSTTDPENCYGTP